MGKFADDLFPVSPGKSGAGLPYAPVDYPNPGDIWRWASTGKAVKKNGCFKDRILYVPERLQKRPSRKVGFMSKKSVVHFLQSELPEVDVNAFFRSFTWEIPAKTDPKTEGTITTHIHQSAASEEGSKRCEKAGGDLKFTLKYSRRKGQRPSNDMIEETLANVEVTNYLKDVSIGQASYDQATYCADGNICGSVPDSKLATPKFSLEQFDNFVNCLDEILSKHGCCGFVEARQKLSSLLAMGFPNLVSSNRISELLSLAEVMKNDPTISDKELSVLKLIQEIPSIIHKYLEVKESSEQVDKNFVELESKVMVVSRLKNEYTTAKHKKEDLQAEESSLMSLVSKTNDKIKKLQSEIEKLQWESTLLTEDIKKTKERIVQCDCIQQKVMDCLPQAVQELETANSKKETWQLKRKELSEQEAEILAKFAPFMGFSFWKMS